MTSIRRLCALPVALTVWALVAGVPLWGAGWQYSVPVERATGGGQRAAGIARLWVPPESGILRGLFLLGQLGIESEMAGDPAIRRACARNDVGIIYFEPHISALFHFWEPGNRDGERLLQAVDDLAARSGHAEIRRVPWIIAGHSTAGIFCRNVGYWMPARVASAGRPVFYEVDYGPIRVEGGSLVVRDLPINPKYPLECKITAYQIGRRVRVAISPAAPVSRVFHVVAAP